MHTQNQSMAAGTAVAISYNSNIDDVTIDNLAVFTVRQMYDQAYATLVLFHAHSKAGHHGSVSPPTMFQRICHLVQKEAVYALSCGSPMAAVLPICICNPYDAM